VTLSQSDLTDSFRAAVLTAVANPPQTKPQMTSMVIQVAALTVVSGGRVQQEVAPRLRARGPAAETRLAVRGRS